MRPFTVSELQVVVKELNNLEFGFDLPLNEKLKTVRELIDEITPNALHLQENDPLCDKTKSILCEMGVGPWLKNLPDGSEGIEDLIGGNNEVELDEEEEKDKELLDVVDAIVGKEIKTQREVLPMATEPAAPKAKKEPKEPKKPALLSRYGHRVGSMAAAIDDMLWKGIKETDATATLAKDFKKTEKAALAKFKGHVAYLPKECGVQVSEKEGFYKAQRATLPDKA